MKATKNIVPPPPPPPVTYNVTLELSLDEAATLLSISRLNVSIPEMFEQRYRDRLKDLLNEIRAGLQTAGIKDSF